MVKFVIPAILIGLALALFFIVANPIYLEIKDLRLLSISYNEALDNSKALEAERDKLTAKYNTFDPDYLAKLEKLMPDSVDNIRLILEIEKLALPYGMVLQDVGYDTTTEKGITGGGGQPGITTSRLPYGIWNLSFSTAGTYGNFVNFLKDLENNLRIVDVSSIDFSSEGVEGLNPSLPQAYKYDFNIQTYWLRN